MSLAWAEKTLAGVDEDDAVTLLYVMRQKFEWSVSRYAMPDVLDYLSSHEPERVSETTREDMRKLVLLSWAWDEADHGNDDWNLCTSIQHELDDMEGFIAYDDEGLPTITEKGRARIEQFA